MQYTKMGKGRGPTRLLSNSTSLSTAVQYNLPVPLLRDARPAGWVHCFQYMLEYNAESPKQDSKRFNSQGREIIGLSGYIIYL